MSNEDVTGITLEIKAQSATITGDTYTVSVKPGEYKASAVLSGEGYNTLALNATLTINKIDMAGISFDGGIFINDTQEHKISITGNVPNGASVVYAGGENGEKLRCHADYKRAVEIIESFEKAISSDEISAIAIFTQRHTHGELVSKALLAGKDVYSAVPMAIFVGAAAKYTVYWYAYYLLIFVVEIISVVKHKKLQKERQAQFYEAVTDSFLYMN